jgi:hypothetical protein
MYLFEDEDVFCSPLPLDVDLTVEFAFSAPVCVAVMALLNHRAISVEYPPVAIPAGVSAFFAIARFDRLILSAGEVFEFPVCPGMLFAYLKIRCRSSVIVKFGVVGKQTVGKGKIVPPDKFFRAGNPGIPMGALFADSFHESLIADVRNTLAKDIYAELLPAISLSLGKLVKLVHALLCDSVPIGRVIRVEVFQRAERGAVNLGEILAGVDGEEFVGEFTGQLEALVRKRELHGIWRNNTAAFRESGVCEYSNCVVFEEKISVIGITPELRELKGFALPVTQLARSGIEILRFARNAVQVAIQLGCENALDRIRGLAKEAIEDGSIVFTSPDLYSVEDFICQIRSG